MEENKQSLSIDGSIVGYGGEKLTQVEADYNPFGFTANEGCASCKWFEGYSNHCHVVEGIIVPTGKSNMYRPLFPDDQMSELLQDFAESMGEGMEAMELGAAMADEKSHKRTFLDRLLRRAPKEAKAVSPHFETPTGFKVVGDNMWIAWYTNPYQDRDGEWFAEKGIDDDIAYMQATGNYPELWRYHISKPGNPTESPTRHGKAITVTKSGRIVIAVGEFDSTPLAQALKGYYKENPDQGVSHGFYYDPAQKINNVYHKFHTFEISTLPPSVASNPFADFGIKEGDQNMPANDKAIADLKAALNGRLPDDLIESVVDAAKNRSDLLDNVVSHKSTEESENKEEKPAAAELSADTKAIINALHGLSAEIKGLKAAMDSETEDDEEEETAPKKKPKKTTGKAKAENANSLSPEITQMLRGLIEEKELNEDSKEIESRELDPASLVMSKVFSGGKQ